MNRPELPASGEVQVRAAPLDRPGAELARLERLLSADELARAGRLLDRLARDRFIAGRAFLRETLAGYLGEEPAAVGLAAGEFGKPCLADPEQGGRLRFNLSHAGDRLLLAVAADREVGIDLELVREGLPLLEMAERFFSPRERAELFSLPPGQLPAAFYRCWTRKEAYLKGSGSGFSQPSDGFDVSLLPGHPPALLAHRRSPAEPARWSLIDLPVPEGYRAALAAAGGTPVIRFLPCPEATL